VEICKKFSRKCGVFFIIWRFPFPDAAAKAADNKQFEIEFKAEYDRYMKCKQELETNMSTAHAFL
jgi:hypothetical protein